VCILKKMAVHEVVSSHYWHLVLKKKKLRIECIFILSTWIRKIHGFHENWRRCKDDKKVKNLSKQGFWGLNICILEMFAKPTTEFLNNLNFRK